jgi:G:T-mismatch repair DNA endonuclease (very short patch repair protein)
MKIAWNKGLRKDTDERVRHASEKMVGKKRTEIGCKNISAAQKKRYTTTEHPFKQAENKEKRRKTLIGHAVSAETRKKLSQFRQGKSWAELLGIVKAEHAKEKSSQSMRGRPTWQKGFTKETHSSLKKLSAKMKVINSLATWRKMYPARAKQVAEQTGRQNSNRLRNYVLEHPGHQKMAFAKLLEKHPNHQREASIKSCLKQNGFISSIEGRTEQYLLDKNIVYAKQVELLDICVVDFLLADGVPIFCDGCYWHACPDHHPEYTKQNFGARERDCFIVGQLIQNGYTPIRLWEHEIRNNDFSKLEALLRIQ